MSSVIPFFDNCEVVSIKTGVIVRDLAQNNKSNELRVIKNESEIAIRTSFSRWKAISETVSSKRIAVRETEEEVHAVTPSITNTIANSIVMNGQA